MDREKNIIFGYDSGPQMFTDEANEGVMRAIVAIEAMARDDLTIRNRETLVKAASPLLRAVGALHDEIWDTEPRNWIAGKLDLICKMNGWAYDEYDSYDW